MSMKRNPEDAPPVPPQVVIDLWERRDILAGVFYDFESRAFNVIVPTEENVEREQRGDHVAVMWAEPLIINLMKAQDCAPGEWPAEPTQEWAAEYAQATSAVRNRT